ncbi:hypothetical protein M5K25_013685 [Dendrobium thyrsiflorum]|uniref:Uncharacterized protein n=1 Tax=Dendrobium thyrsiflorum TaxID=117978 RepID=A0ABD0UUE8_DENTH
MGKIERCRSAPKELRSNASLNTFRLWAHRGGKRESRGGNFDERDRSPHQVDNADFPSHLTVYLGSIRGRTTIPQSSGKR